MLRTEFPTDIAITLGAMATPIKDQVAAAGMVLDNHEQWERRHQAWNLLRIGGFLTKAEVQRIGRRLVRGIAQDSHFDTARAELGQEILKELHIQTGPAEPVVPAEEGSKESPAEDPRRELGRYIGFLQEAPQL